MKRVLLLLAFACTFLSSQPIYSQGLVTLLCEDFETAPYEMFTYSRFPNDSLFRQIDTLGFPPTTSSMLGIIGSRPLDAQGNRSESYLQTPYLQISNFSNLSVEFAHIAYLSQFDQASLQYTFNGGLTWQTANRSQYKGNPGRLLQPGNYFSQISYAQEWKFTPIIDSMFIWNQGNAEWKYETWDFGPTIRNRLPSPDSIAFRIKLLDAGSRGAGGTYRYFIDDFCVLASNCPTDQTTLEVDDPPANYPQRYEGRIYWEGPYDFNAKVIDANGIEQVRLDYEIVRETAPGVFTTTKKSIPMPQSGSSVYYSAQIPKAEVQIGDTVRWRVKSYDLTACRDSTADPIFQEPMEAFEVRSSLPVTCNTQPKFDFPYIQDFNDSNLWVLGSEVLADGWSNVEGDLDNDWLIHKDTTLTISTGPRDDMPGGGRYLYVEGTGNQGKLTFLVSPCFDLFGKENSLVRFYVHQNTSGDDTLYVDVFDTDPQPGFPLGRYVENVIPPIPGNKGDNWIPYEFSLFPFKDQVTQIRIRAKPDLTSDLSDIAIDSFKVVDAPLIDARADRVVIPPFMPTGENENVTIGVQNQGVFDITSLTFGYDIINEKTGQREGGETSVPWSGLIKPAENINITLSPTYIVPKGRYRIKAWLNYANDEVILNDTTNQLSVGVPYRDIYFTEDFDGQEQTFTVLTDSDTLFNFWELGSPKFGKTDRAFTKPNAWDINLDRAYSGVGNVVQLMTPMFDLTGSQDVYMSFMNNRAVNKFKDGVYIEYSLNQGISWDSLKSLHDPGRLKWYNSYLAADGFGGQPVFAGVTRFIENNWYNWLESELQMSSELDNEPRVLFRFNFFSEEGNSSNDGMSIDNFLLYDRAPIDISPQFMKKPYEECDMTANERFLVVFKNRGETPISSFNVKYVVENLETGEIDEFSEMVNKTVQPRDTIEILTQGGLDMRSLGDWKVQIITSLAGDGYAINDTLTNIVEHIDGCYVTFEVNTGAYKRPAVVDSSYWRFEYTSGNREYVVTDSYVPFDEETTNLVPVCFKKNSFVKFTLGDRDSTIINYSLYAYDGEVDTILVDRSVGGTATPTRYFDWDCPPDSSGEAIKILLDNDTKQIPISKEYLVQLVVRNDGLDSIQTMEVGLDIDNGAVFEKRIETFNPLEYNRFDTISFGLKYLSPGRHKLVSWVHSPNGNADEVPENDTTERLFIAIDTLMYGKTRLDSNGATISLNSTRAYCADFEDGELPEWIPLNFDTYLMDEDVIFERDVPSTASLSGPYTGAKSWVTDADGTYPILNSSFLLSPFFDIQKDSCYRITFAHNYAFDDFDNDGAQIQYLTNLDLDNWRTLDLREVGTGDTALQMNWYNTNGVDAFPNRESNQGWTGNSNGWVRAQTMLPGYEAGKYLFGFKFGSDGNNNSEGWAIDNFCIERVQAPIGSKCFAVGLGEEKLDLGKVYLGQNQPNPADYNTQIPYYLPKSAKVHFEVTNMVGQTIYTEDFSKNEGNHLITLDISNFESGVYYYWMMINDLKISKKMIITK